MKVPVPQAPSIAPQAVPTQRMNIQASPIDFGGAQADAVQRLGATGMQAADATSRDALMQAQLDNEAGAKDAYATQYDPAVRKLFFDPKDGYYTKQGKDAIDAYPALQQSITDLRKSTLDSLPNPEQKRLFTDASLRRQELELDGADRYASQQRIVYRDQMSDAMVNSQQQNAIAFYNDPTRFGGSLKSGVAEIESHGLDKGEPAAMTQQKVQKFTSSVYAGAVERQAVNDPVGALDAYRKNIDQIDGPVRLQLEDKLKSAVYPVQSRLTAQRIMQGGTMPQTSSLIDAVAQQESGGMAGAVSPKGALGVMQLMPDTAREVAAKLGVPYDEDKLQNDAAYNKQLGTAYLQEQLRRYGGDQTLALAAYNAGPANVDKWVAQYGDPRTGAISDADFVAKIPFQETQNYVTAINAKVPTKAGTAPTSDDVRKHLPDWLDAADTEARKFSDDPVYIDQVKSHILTEAHQIETGHAYIEKDARDTLLSSALGVTKAPGGGYTQAVAGTLPKSLPDLLSTPGAQQAWSRTDPVQQHGILALLEHNAKDQDPPMTPDALARYYTLKGEAGRDPIAFGNENLADKDLLNLLPHHLTIDLMNVQAALSSKAVKDAAKGENLLHAAAISKPMLMSAGIAIPTKPGDKAALYDQFMGRLSGAIDDYTKANSRTPNDSDLRQMTTSLLTAGSAAGSGWISRGGILGIGGDKAVRAFQVPAGQFQAPVPSTERPKIVKDFQAINGRAPTDNEIAEIYTAHSISGGR